MNTNLTVQPYLFFEGRCEEAMEFYKKSLGAEVLFSMRFKDSPDPGQCPTAPGMENKIMHATFRVGAASIMASDGRCSGGQSFQGFALSVNAADEAEAKRFFDALGAGGQVIMPLGKTFYSDAFGMVTDKFGIMWMVIIPKPMMG